MKIRFLTLTVAVCLLLTGCASLLEREYSTVEPHVSKFWESEAAGTLRAESYQDVVNGLIYFINRGAESGSIRFDESSNPESDMVTGDFVFDVKVSPGIPAKSITGRVRCTTEGLTTLFGGDQNA